MLAVMFWTKVAAAAPRARDIRSDAAHIEREIANHVRAISLYENESSSCDEKLRAFAQRILPQLQRHLAILRSLEHNALPPNRDAPLKPRS